MIGPAKASVTKINDFYRFMIYVKCADYKALTDRKDAMEEALLAYDGKNIRVQFDFDPMNAY